MLIAAVIIGKLYSDYRLPLKMFSDKLKAEKWLEENGYKFVEKQNLYITGEDPKKDFWAKIEINKIR